MTFSNLKRTDVKQKQHNMLQSFPMQHDTSVWAPIDHRCMFNNNNYNIFKVFLIRTL